MPEQQVTIVCAHRAKQGGKTREVEDEITLGANEAAHLVASNRFVYKGSQDHEELKTRVAAQAEQAAEAEANALADLAEQIQALETKPAVIAFARERGVELNVNPDSINREKLNELVLEKLSA